jgi:hypothetical protein
MNAPRKPDSPPAREASTRTPALIKQSTEFTGTGCVLQGVGLMAGLLGFAMGPIGMVFGLGVALLLIVEGSNKSKRLLCGHCGNRVDNKTVTLCPACRSALTYKGTGPGAVIFLVVIITLAVGLRNWLMWVLEG